MGCVGCGVKTDVVQTPRPPRGSDRGVVPPQGAHHRELWRRQTGVPGGNQALNAPCDAIHWKKGKPASWLAYERSLGRCTLLRSKGASHRHTTPSLCTYYLKDQV